MAIRKTTSTAIKDAPKDEGPLYISMAGDQGAKALAEHSMPENCFTQASSTNVTVRPGFNRFDRDYYRDEEILPIGHAEIIKACQAIYKRIGLVRNIIDLMADFASEGIDLIHPIRRDQNFLRKWAEKVNLQSRAHDFMKNLLRDGNTIVRRKMGKITAPGQREMSKAKTDPEGFIIEEPEKIGPTKKPTKTKVIPWRFVFISPATCEKTGGPLARFCGDDGIAMRLSPQLIRAIKTPKTEAEKKMVAGLPAEVLNAVRGNKRQKLVPLDPTKTFVSYYKKDDWEDWGTSFLYSVLEDVQFKDKMRQADIAALDGVINVIRIWKLGNSDKQILPTKGAVSKLLGILENNTGGGALDIVWDDMIDLQTETPPVDKILGPAKYQTVNQDIVRGLGVPDALLGGSESTTRNAQSAFVQLKTLVERLEYVRNKALEWITAELKLVCDAMGIKKLPTVIFGTMSLRDEAAEKALVIQLLDRGIISVETVHSMFGYDYLVELEHMREEQQLRNGEKPILEKAGPYYRPESLIVTQTDQQLRVEKFKVDNPGQGPGRNGGGDNPAGDQPKNDSTPPGPGRPANKPSTKPRDTRTPVTLSTVHVCTAMDYLDRVDGLLDPIYLTSNGLPNIRKASAQQRTELESVKWAVLCCVRPGDIVTQDSIQAALDRTDDATTVACDKIYRRLAVEYSQVAGHTPGLRERRQLMASAWATFVATQHV